MKDTQLKLNANEIEMLLEAMNRTNCYYGSKIERENDYWEKKWEQGGALWNKIYNAREKNE